MWKRRFVDLTPNPNKLNEIFRRRGESCPQRINGLMKG